MCRSPATRPKTSRSIVRATSIISSMKSQAPMASTSWPRMAFARALALGAEPADVSSAQKTLDVPAIKGIGGSLLYFIDRYGAKGSAYDFEFDWLGARDARPAGAGLFYLDHLTHNVQRG